MKIILPDFKDKSELFKFLHLNKDTLKAQKKSEIKHADAVDFVPMIIGAGESGEAIKANELIKSPPDVLNTELVINTTNLLDGHDDVHLPGIWDKSLKESKDIMHIQEHQSREFKYIIADGDDVKAYVKQFDWKQLNADLPGATQALMFDSKVRKERNEFMHEQYAKGYVKQHSVGMRYVQLALAINDKDYGSEYEVWEKYFDQIANKETAEEQGYFWAVREAKVIEGSAVPKGSNWVTPTRFNNKTEPSEDTQLQNQEPSEDTPDINEFKLLIKNVLNNG